ncbi:MAG: DUF4339 domain-containing protein [Chthoniobacteraceae bacterium]
MILAQLYYILGWVCLIAGGVGITGNFVSSLYFLHLPEAVGVVVVGLVCFGLAGICDAIGKISLNSKKTADLLEAVKDALANTDRLRAEEATSIRDLLVKVAVSAPSIMPASVNISPAATPASFLYSNDDTTTRGPFSIETMRAMIRDGVIRTETPVAREGSEEWFTYAAFPELV